MFYLPGLYRLCINAIITLFLFSLINGCAKKVPFLEKYYTKAEYRIPMRDGIRLFTTVYTPRDKSQLYPILLWRTPYSVAPYGENKYPTKRIDSWHHLAEEKFIFVYQDVRGRFMSEGEYSNMRPYIPVKTDSLDIDETTDTYDTIEWLVRNTDQFNGKVGMWGISYPGFYAAMGTMDAHPALVAVSPQAPIADWFIGDDMHHHGALSLLLSFDFFSTFGVPRQGLTTEWSPDFKYGTPDGYRFFLEMGPLANSNHQYLKNSIPFWNEVMIHDTYDDFWKSRSTVQHFNNNVKPVVMTVGGWFDAENCYGALHTYQTIEKKNPAAFNMLVMGPWFHGGWVRSDGSNLGPVEFGSKTGDFYEQNIELPFFGHFLKDKTNPDLPEAFVFETGVNQWHQLPDWPPENGQPFSLYLNPQRELSFFPPENERLLYDEYVSDPARPVPFTARITTSMPREYMVEDQRFAASRPDVLVYKTETLSENVTLTGPITVELYVSTSGTDADWIVKLIDVYPDDAPDPADNPNDIRMGGYQMLVRGDIMRSRFRDSYEQPKGMIPGEITEINFTMNDIYHTFLSGHKIMLQIQSSWFPLFDRNPQKFVKISTAGEPDFKKAVQRVYHTSNYPSAVHVSRLY